MSLSKIDYQIASEVFAKYAKHDFAYGYFEQPIPIVSTTSTAASASTGFTHVMKMKTTECKAEVSGLDRSAFLEALDEFMELSRAHLLNTLSYVEETDE